MRWCDAHIDLAYLALGGRDMALSLDEARTSDAGATITLPSLREGDVRWAFATVFTGQGFEGPGGYSEPSEARAKAIEQLDVYRRWEDDGSVRIVRSAPDLELGGDHALRIVLLMEGGDPIDAPGDVAWWRDVGVRIVGLSWWPGSRYSGGNGKHGPLTEAGRAVVDAISEAGLIHDLSHLADESAWELLDRTEGPVIASHSNARALMDGTDQRHLSDELIAAIGARGGVVGLNLYQRFLTLEDSVSPEATIGHVLHAAEVMGRRDGVGLGSDADGGFGADGLPEGVDRPADYLHLAEALRSAGWTDDEVAGFASANWLSLLRSHL